MKHPRRLLLVALVAVMAAALWAGWYRFSSRPRPAAPALPQLSSDARARIDGIAATSTLETVEQEQINFAGDITAWFIDHALPSADEEAHRVAGMSEKILSKYRTVPTPASADQILRRLTDPLPPHLKPSNFSYTLTVLEVPELGAFTCGGGPVYVTRPLLEAFSGAGERAEAAFAFILAHELGHMALLHCRRGWQRVELQEELDQGLQLVVPVALLRSLIQTDVAAADSLVPFLYSRNQEYEADLFALHLCRNAGYAPDDVLDGMRYLVIQSHPAILTQSNYRPDPAEDRSALGYFLSAAPDTLYRLKRLLLERDGIVEDTRRFGLFAYDRTTSKCQRCEDRSIPIGQRPVILLHGLGGDEDSFAVFLAFLAGSAQVRDRPLLMFRYPNNESLSRCGLYLHREVGRVIADPRSASFICHSAGGLVFRYYAENQRGSFDQAVFLGTPHRGSDLARLRLLAEAAEYGRDLLTGLSLFGLDPRGEGRGQIIHDLHADSLFLRHLGRDANLAGRYHIFFGRRLDRFQGFALRTSFVTTAPLLRERLAGQISSTCIRRCAMRLLEGQMLPEEVLDGDLVVAVKSARLEGAGQVVETALDHQALKTDESIMHQVLHVLENSGS
jgi:pimeloyl-ACP methyl ester carboxylesterase